MFATVVGFELRYQLKSPVFWVSFALFFLLAFGATTIDQIQIGGGGASNVNAPYAIVQTLGIMGVFGLFVVTAFVAGAVIRDDETRFAPLLRATRLGKPAYVFGRFAGAMVVAWLVMAAVALGMWAGSFMPWLDSEKVGPQVPYHYLWTMVVFVLPTLLVTGALGFALAIATRSLMWTYIGAVAALVGFVATRLLLSDPQYDALSAWTDPFGVSALGLATKYWTSTERNTLLPGLEGPLLLNRALWLTIAAAALALAYAAFRMDGRPLWQRRRPAFEGKADAPPPAASPLAARQPLPAPAPQRARWAQFWEVARFDAASVFKSPAFFVLMAIGVLNAFGGLWAVKEVGGSEIYPATRVMVEGLEGAFSIIPIIIAIFYAGELVWRERAQRMHEIVDATVAPDWVHLLPKIAAIAGVLVAAGAVAIATGIAVQLVLAYTTFELTNYLLWYLLPQTVTALLLAVLAVFVQTLVPSKMVGWAVMLVYLVASVALATTGFEHNLYIYGGTPPVPLSDMNGMGHFWVGRAWFQAYWATFAVMLVVLAYALRRRGAEATLAARLRRLPQRLAGAPGAVLASSALVWVGLGGWIFYNTNVLGEYQPQPQREAMQARFERALLAYEDLPQPTVTHVQLDVRLFPRERRALTEGRYTLENRSDAPLTHMHMRWSPGLTLESAELPAGVVEKEYDDFNYRIYRLDTPLEPGQSRVLRFRTRLEEIGFRNGLGLTSLVDNGSFLNNWQIAPMIGMDRSGLLQDPSKRRRHGLEPQLRMPKLEDDSARAHHYLRRDSDWVHAEIRLETDADQIPVAPGTPVSDTVEGKRRVLLTRTEAPIQHFFSMQSGRYAVSSRDHKGTELAVYHLPRHDSNVERMLDAMAVSIDLFSEVFSEYQFPHARVLEFPGYARFAQAFAGTMPYSEAIGFQMRHRDEEKIDMVTYVTAHEVAHQWWAHQVIGANMQGSTFLSETFAQYSALLVMERLYGPAQIRRFLKYELDRYLRARGSELIEELPLARVENQPYIHYQKGTLAMYWLKEVVGEAVVNRALQRLIERFAFQPAPYPNSLDFIAMLREEAGPAHDALITDLFERIVLVDARTTDASARALGDGRWELTLEIEARKRVADGQGVETEEPLDEVFEVGAFTAEPGRRDFSQASVLHLQQHRLSTGLNTVTLMLDGEPRWAGVDPYNKRIDRNSDDNLRRVGVAR
jgi:ABC-2 type transport system permease protein